MSNGAAVAAAGYAAAVQAVKASGAIVRVEPDAFSRLVGKNERPLVIVAEEKVFKTTYKYLVSYGGFVFFTKSAVPLALPGRAEVVAARKIWVPS
jgi:hypothetical protein